MSNHIHLVSEKTGKLLKTKKYIGLGQILKISDDGFEKHIVLEPEDPVFGVTIKYIETGSPYFSFPDVAIEKMDIFLDNINQAKAFCKEFYLRKTEFLGC